MKRNAITPVTLLCLLLWSLAGCRSASTDFVLTDGSLTAYNGAETEITLPEEVIRIGSGAFEGSPAADRITRITLGTQVEEIDLTAFSGLPALQGVELSPENTSFHSARDDRSGVSFLCAA